ncbi:MAG: hypothetical protein EHM30_10770, partial [Desulfobacteraceae bacterium]
FKEEGITTSALDVLMNHESLLFGRLLEMDEKQLLKIKHLGKRSLKDLKDSLKEKNLYLKKSICPCCKRTMETNE